MAQDTVRIPLKNYKNTRSDYLPPDTYDFKVTDADVAESGKGNTMIMAWLDVESGPYAGYQLIERLTLTDAAMWRVVGFLRAAGIKTKPGQDLDLPLAKLKGLRVRGVVEDDTFQGRVNSKVQDYYPAEGGGASGQQSEPADLEVPEATGSPEQEPEPTPQPTETVESSANGNGEDQQQSVSVQPPGEIDLNDVQL